MPPHTNAFIRTLNFIAGWMAVGVAFFLPLSTTLANVLFIAAPVLYFCTGDWRNKFQAIWQRRAIAGYWVLFLGMLIAITYSAAPTPAAWQGLAKFDKLLFGVLFLPLFLTEKWRSYAIHAFLAGIVVTLCVALLIILGLLSNNNGFSHLLMFKDRIQTSFLMAIAAYISGIFFFDNLNHKIKWLYAGLFLVTTFFLFSIDGRSGYVVFCVLFAWLLWDKKRWHGLVYAIVGIACILTAAYFFSPPFQGRAHESVNDIHLYQKGENDTSLGLRAKFVQNSFSLIPQHPFIGTGTGSFATEYDNLKVPAYLQTHNPHNQYVFVLVQWGVVGLLLLGLLLLVQLKDSLLLPPTMRQLAQGVIIAVALGCLANSWLMDTTESHFYVYFTALAFASQTKPKTLLPGIRST